MNELKIKIGKGLYTSTVSTNISTVFYIQFDDKIFPSNKWTDFSDPILFTWVQKLVNNRNLAQGNEKLYFIDGPYRLDISKEESMKLKVECVNYKYKKVVEAFFYCSYDELLKALYDALKKFSYLLYSNRMSNENIDSSYKQSLISLKEIRAIMYENL